MCSIISCGPVAQLSPITSRSYAPSAVSAAPISLPSNMVPLLSMVTWAMRGRRRPAAAMASWQPTIAALA